MYHRGNRELQKRFGTERLADRLEQVEARAELNAEDRAMIEAASFFLLATADLERRPLCSYKGGLPGFVRVLDARRLAFPDYDGNGTFRSLGNLEVNPFVSLFFLDLERRERTLVEGQADVSDTDPLLAEWAGAQLVIRVEVHRAFSSCSRYIHRFQKVEDSVFVPRDGHEPPVPEWKTKDRYRDVLPRK